MALEERLARHAAARFVDCWLQEPVLDEPSPRVATDRATFQAMLEEEIYQVLLNATGILRKKIEVLEGLVRGLQAGAHNASEEKH
jgi:hypothetical protein